MKKTITKVNLSPVYNYIFALFMHLISKNNFVSQVNDFGSVSFGRHHDFAAIPSMIQGVNMVFPYLALQSFSCPGQSIFHHIYDSNDESDSTTVTHVNGLIRAHYSESQELNLFSALFIVVITWHRGREGICDYQLTCLEDQVC